MIPLTTVSECITEHIRARSECNEGYNAVLIGLLILFTAQLLPVSHLSFLWSASSAFHLYFWKNFPQRYLTP